MILNGSVACGALVNDGATVGVLVSEMVGIADGETDLALGAAVFVGKFTLVGRRVGLNTTCAWVGTRVGASVGSTLTVIMSVRADENATSAPRISRTASVPIPSPIITP